MDTENTDDMETRKQNRLKGYDYSQNGVYFITICTVNKQKLLCNIVGDDAHIVPTKYGTVVEKFMKSMPGIDKYVIMPNHVHLIVNNENGAMWASPPTVSQKIKSFKIMVTKTIGKPIFQRSFYDHVIRDEEDYLRIWEYIENNPGKWTEDKYFI